MRRAHILLIVLAGLVLVGCAPGVTTYGGEESQAGFLWGVWHGWIAPISIAWHFLVDDAARVYETNNDGIFYDIGFYVAIISGFGSISLSRKASKR